MRCSRYPHWSAVYQVVRFPDADMMAPRQDEEGIRQRERKILAASEQEVVRHGEARIVGTVAEQMPSNGLLLHVDAGPSGMLEGLLELACGSDEDQVDHIAFAAASVEHARRQEVEHRIEARRRRRR